MQCGPIRFFLSAWKAARFSPFKRKVIPRFTNFVWNNSDSGSTIHEIYAALVADAPRNDMIARNKKEVLVYDYADMLVPMLARMYKKRLVGYSALGYAAQGGPPIENRSFPG